MFVIKIFLAILALILVLTYIIVLFSFLTAFLERKTSHTPEPNLKLYQYLSAYLLEGFFVFLKYLLYPCKFINTNKNTDKSGKKPIVFVHGYTRNKTDWLWFINKLAKNTQQPIYTLDLGPPLSSIQQLAENLKLQLINLKTKTNYESITLIGHSMGGLICHFLDQYLAENLNVTKIITLGSPLYGTKTAFLGFGENSKQMAFNSKFLQMINAKDFNNPKNYFIASKFDNMIIPWDSALPKDNNNNFILTTQTHQGLLYSNEVVQKIISWCN